MPATELCDRPVTLEQVWGRPAVTALRDRLAAATRPHEMLTLLEEELVRRLCETAGLGLVRHASSVLAATSGAVAIGDLSAAAGVSSTHLAHRFKELIGVTPKRLARTHRFTATVFAIDPDGADRLERPRRLAQATSTRPTSATSSGRSPGSRRPGTSRSGGSSCANIPATCSTAGRCRPIDFLQERRLRAELTWPTPQAEESPVGKVVMYSSVSVDGFIADEDDQPGPLFDWLLSGDVPLDESGVVKVSQTSYDYIRPYWDQIGATIVGRHVFDITDGWDGTPPGGIDHVVVVTHRPAPEGWDPEAPFHFVDGVEAAVATAQELAGDRIVEVAAGDVGGQVLAAGLVDEVRMDVVPVVLGSGKRYFGSVDAQHLLEDPDVVIQGNRVLHLRYQVRR